MPTLAIGSWRVTTLETGYLWLDGGSMFGSVPKPLWSKLQPPDERNRIRLAMRCLLLEGDEHTILVDDGIDEKFPPKLKEIYRLENDEHTLDRSLLAHDLTTADITDVVLTHLHFDHAGGSTRLDRGQLVPRFPHARYHVQKKNLANARRPNPRERASYMPDDFEPLATLGVLDEWDGPQKPWPGVEMFTADGHTRGQQLLRVSGPQGTLYYVADLIPTASHVRIPFVMGYDVAAIETMEEKRALLTRASEERAWIVIEHDPLVAMARPKAEGDDFTWDETVPADLAQTKA